LEKERSGGTNWGAEVLKLTHRRDMREGWGISDYDNRDGCVGGRDAYRVREFDIILKITQNRNMQKSKKINKK
jgi:hypothetical protein